MSYIAPMITDLGTVRELTLQANGNANGKAQMFPDGVSGTNGKGVIGSL